MMQEKAWRLSMVWIVATFLAGVAYSFYLDGHFLFYDETEYYTIAQNMAHKGIYALYEEIPTAWRPPGYAFFLTPWVYFGGNLIVLRILNFAALSLSMYLVALILRSYSAIDSLIGVLLMFCYPVLFFTASTLYPQTIATTLLLFSVWLIFRREDLSYPSAVALGIAQGFLILCIPTFASHLIFICFWLFTRPVSCLFSKILTILAMAVIVLMPWTIRNYTLFHQFVFVSTNGGVNLLLGNSPNTRPNSGVNTDLSNYLTSAAFENEVAADHYYRDQALDYMKTHPVESVKLYGQKLLNFFNYENEIATKGEGTPLHSILMFLTYGMLLLIALIRLTVSNRFPLNNFDAYLILSYLFTAALMAMFFTRIRFRLPVDPFLILLNARFLGDYILRKFQSID